MSVAWTCDLSIHYKHLRAAHTSTSPILFMSSLQILGVDQLPMTPGYDLLRRDPPDINIVGSTCHCGIWWKNPPEAEEQFGIIGHYSADNAKDSKILLDQACEYLKAKGCAAAIGPMNGSTWKSYRFVTWSDGSMPFLLEPRNPADWPEYWLQAGFSPFHEYISTINSHLEQSDPRLVNARERLHRMGTTWRSLDTSRFVEELRQVYHLSLEAFSKNILYTPLAEEDFLRQYLPFAGKINKDYVLLAHDDAGKYCGFIFAIPDLLQLQHGTAVNRLIIKTLAVSANRRSGGLGAILVEEVQRKARQNGLSAAVHALMYSKNNSTNIGKTTQPMRRYTLFIRRLS